MMDLKNFKSIKKNDFAGWLRKGNIWLYAAILLVFASVLFFVFSALKTMHDEDGNKSSELYNNEDTSVYIAQNKMYMLNVNIKKNYIVVFKADSNGEYNDFYKVMRCSVSDKIKEGEFKITDRLLWKRFSDNEYGHYTVQLGENGYIHSVPYKKQDISTINAQAYNNLGSHADIGYIYLNSKDSRWIFENCGNETIVKIYSDENENYNNKLDTFEKIADNAQYDPNDDNKTESRDSSLVQTRLDRMFGTRDTTTTLNSNFDMWAGVGAVDENGNDVTSYIKATGSVDTSVAGAYNLVYEISDIYGKTIRYNREVLVIDSNQPQTNEAGVVVTSQAQETTSAQSQNTLPETIAQTITPTQAVSQPAATQQTISSTTAVDNVNITQNQTDSNVAQTEAMVNSPEKTLPQNATAQLK